MSTPSGDDPSTDENSDEVAISKRWIIAINLVSAVLVALVGGAITAVLTANPYGPSIVSRIAGSILNSGDVLTIDSNYSGTMCGSGATLHVSLRGLRPQEEIRLRAIPIEQNVQYGYLVLSADDEGEVSSQDFNWRYRDGECPGDVRVITVQIQVYRESPNRAESYWITKDVPVPVL